MAVVVTIGGVTKTLQPNWSILATPNGNDTLHCVVKSLDGSYRPAMDAEIVLTENGTAIFGGTIQTPRERGILTKGTGILTTISAISFDAMADRRYVSATIPTGTLKAALIVLTTYLATYGITLDAAQVDGPSLPALTYDYRKLRDILDELASFTGYIWEISYTKVLRMFAPGTITAPVNIVDGDRRAIGDVEVSTTRAAAGGAGYANRVIVRGGTPEAPVTAIANNTAEQTAHQLWETVIAAPTASDTATAQALADAYILQTVLAPKIVRYDTYETGLKPGQTQTITLATRNVNNTFLLTEVETRNNEANLVMRSVTAIEGSFYQGSWRNLYRQWSSGVANVFPVVTSVAGQRIAYFLGGSAVEAVQSATPTWVPSSAVQVTLDTVARGSVNAIVTVRLKAASGNVTARLRNVSDGITVGTSAAVASPTFQTVTFAVTLTAGSKIYQLEVLPSAANVDVSAVGYIE